MKPGPRHLRTRPDPGQNRLGHHKGIPSGEARQCTPTGTEAVISALAPTAPPPIKAAQNATTVDTRSKTVALCTRRVHLLTPTSQRDQISQGISSQGPGHRQTGHTQEPRLPTGPRPDTLTHTRQAEALELRCPGNVHGPPATTTNGVKTQPKARPKQGPRSPEPVLKANRPTSVPTVYATHTARPSTLSRTGAPHAWRPLLPFSWLLPNDHQLVLRRCTQALFVIWLTFIGGGAVGAKAKITASVPAGVHWRASPEGMPLWAPNRF